MTNSRVTFSWLNPFPFPPFSSLFFFPPLYFQHLMLGNQRGRGICPLHSQAPASDAPDRGDMIAAPPMPSSVESLSDVTSPALMHPPNLYKIRQFLVIW